MTTYSKEVKTFDSKDIDKDIERYRKYVFETDYPKLNLRDKLAWEASANWLYYTLVTENKHQEGELKKLKELGIQYEVDIPDETHFKALKIIETLRGRDPKLIQKIIKEELY